MQTPVIEILQAKPDDHREVATVAPTDTVAEAVRRMNARRIGAVVVLHGDRMAGIFTERDVLTRVVADKLDADQTTVSEVMTEGPHTIEPTTTVEEAMALMSETRCRHMPVMNGSLVGMISIGDVTRWLVRHQLDQLCELERYVTGAAAAQPESVPIFP